GIPDYSAAALAARDIFSVGFEAVFIYVEDEDQHTLYEFLLSRCVPKGIEFKVFPLAGKRNVLVHATDPTIDTGSNTSIYVLDKDFDDLLGSVIEQPNIIYLDEYCVENAVLCEDALITIACEERPRRPRVDVVTALGYRETMASWLCALDRLHRAFFLA